MIKMDKKYIKNASLMLSRAFKDDPIDEYIFPDPEERKIKIPLNIIGKARRPSDTWMRGISVAHLKAVNL